MRQRREGSLAGEGFYIARNFLIAEMKLSLW
jgi:hypothetical protein